MHISTSEGVVTVGFRYGRDSKKRVVTTANVTIPGCLTPFVGQVTCSKQDHFEKEAGRKGALAKAMKPIDREVRAQIWEGYFARK